MVLFLGLTVALPYLSPKQFSVDSFRDIYGYIMALAIGLMGLIQVAIVLGSMEIFLAKAKYIVAGLMLFFALMGNVMGKVRRNFWMGVRTPWTLANDNVWNMTHRLTGWLWVGFGLLGLVLVLVIPGESILIGCSVGLLVVVFYPVLYSLILYKRLEREGKL